MAGSTYNSEFAWDNSMIDWNKLLLTKPNRCEQQTKQTKLKKIKEHNERLTTWLEEQWVFKWWHSVLCGQWVHAAVRFVERFQRAASAFPAHYINTGSTLQSTLHLQMSLYRWLKASDTFHVTNSSTTTQSVNQS